MEKKSIYSKDLGDIMEAIAEEALKHSDELTTHITIRRGVIEVSATMQTSPYATLSSASYDVITEIEDSTDALDHIFGEALVALESLTAVKQNEDSSLNTK